MSSVGPVFFSFVGNREGVNPVQMRTGEKQMSLDTVCVKLKCGMQTPCSYRVAMLRASKERYRVQYSKEADGYVFSYILPNFDNPSSNDRPPPGVVFIPWYPLIPNSQCPHHSHLLILLPWASRPP